MITVLSGSVFVAASSVATAAEYSKTPPASSVVPSRGLLPKPGGAFGAIKKHPSLRQRASTRALASTGRSSRGYIYQTSTMACNGNRIYGQSDFNADTDYGPTVWVTVTNTLYRWDGYGWVVDIAGPSLSASELVRVNIWSKWFLPDRPASFGPTPNFTIGKAGYYAIVQDISWHDKNRGGALVDSVHAFTTLPGGGYWCGFS
jgi:hypothetical protein